jgi:hypothetical protein
MRRSGHASRNTSSVQFCSHLRDLVWAEAILAGIAPEQMEVVADSLGGLRCPSLGRHIELGKSFAKRSVRVSSAQDEVVLSCDDGMVVRIPRADLLGAEIETPLPTIEANGYELTLFDKLASGHIQVSNRDEWLKAKLTGTNQRTDGIDFYQVDDELYPLQNSSGVLTAALEEICAHWPEVYADLQLFVRVIVPICASVAQRRTVPQASGRRNFAFTVSSRQGAVYIGDSELDETIEMLLHEFAHVKLRQIQAIDPLLVDPLDESIRVSVPWREDKRPLPGVLEGLYVFTHVAEYELRRFVGGINALAPLLERRLHALRFASGCLKSQARVTAAGHEFLDWMDNWVSSLERRLETQTRGRCETGINSQSLTP